MKIANQNIINFGVRSAVQDHQSRVSVPETAILDDDTAQGLMIAGLDDKSLKNMAWNTAHEDYSKSRMRKVERGYSRIFPVADSLINGALTPGTLGDKTLGAVDRGLSWAILALMSKITTGIFKRSPRLQEFAQDHPTFTTLVSSVGTAVVASAAYIGVRLGIDKLMKSSTTTKSLKDGFVNTINRIPHADKISNFLTKNGNGIAKIGLAAFIVLFALAVNSVLAIHRMKKKAERNMGEYMQTRQQITLNLLQKLALENQRLKSGSVSETDEVSSRSRSTEPGLN